MGIDVFVVVLQPNQPVYFPGQRLTGYVKVDASSEVSCREITVTAKGVGKVRWSERHGKTSSTYTAEEEYIRQKALVWNGRDTDNKIRPGHYRFRFNFALPLTIPSSFEATHGLVRYQVKAVVDVPWGVDYTAKTLFSVNHLYDLNADHTAQRRLILQREKNVCCAAGPILISVAAERSGYVPGETIIVNGEVNNHSGSEIRYTEAKIVQQINYITPRKIKEEVRTVHRVYRPQIAAGRTDVWSAVPLPVPALPTSHLQHCNIIVIEYYLTFVAKLGTFRSAKLKAPLVIGSVPLRSSYSMPVQLEGAPEPGGTSLAVSGMLQPSPSSIRPTALMANHEELEDPSGFSDDPPPYTGAFMPDGYQDIPPPSYDSCVFSSPHSRALGGQRIDTGGEDSDGGGFAPQYVTYRMANSAHQNR